MQAPAAQIQPTEGTTVVHPDHGVMEVVGFEERSLKGRTISYVVMVATDGDLQLRVPAERWDAIGVRAPVADARGERALELLAEEPEELPDRWHQRKSELESRLHSGSLLGVTSIVRDLNARGREADLPRTDKVLFRAARDRLVAELRIALDESAERVEELVDAQLAS